MNVIESNIHLINKRIISGFHNIEDIGVLNGLAGLALFNFHYSKTFNKDNKIGYLIIEKCISKINEGYRKPTYCNGILGLGWAINYLIKENFIDSSNNEVLFDIDKYARFWMHLSIKEKNFDFLHGAIGCANYFLGRYNNLTEDKNQELVEDYLYFIIESLTSLLKDIELFSNGYKGVNVKMSFENNVVFGLAHGISSMAFILNKISKIPKFNKESQLLADQYISYLLKYKDKENSGISLFPNFLNSKGVVKYYSALSWCTGDLGVGITLLNTSIYYNNNEGNKQMGIEILKHAAQRTSLDKTLLKTNNLCHGYIGAFKIFSNAYNMTKESDFDKASNYWLNLGLQNLSIENDSDLTILNGLSGIGLTLLEVFDSRRLEWDECLLLR